MANSPAIFILLSKVQTLFDNATFEYAKLNLYLKLYMDKLFLRPVVLMVAFMAMAFHRMLTVIVTVAQQQFLGFAIYD